MAGGAQTDVQTAAPSAAVARYHQKLAAGTYTQVSVPCFCGSTKSRRLVEADRYGCSYAPRLCQDCGLIYASPRLDDASTASFYADEYRVMYGDRAESPAFRSAVGQTIGELLTHFDLHPTRIGEIGCGMGQMLEDLVVQFTDAEVYGCDFDPGAVATARSKAFDVRLGDVTSCADFAGTTDLVIMNHSLEHVLDLPATLAGVASLLSPDGYVFIAVPGLYCWERPSLWQAAHTYQFTATTLGYVMACCGFTEYYADEWIGSLWKYTGEVRAREARPTQEADYIEYFLTHDKPKAPLIKTVNKFPTAVRRAHLAASLARGLPDVTDVIGAHANTQAIIIAGGPSVAAHLDKIRALVDAGHTLLTIERMLPWCLDHGLMPHGVVVMDAEDDVVAALQTPPLGPRYFLASQCHAKVFEAVAHLPNVSIFNTPQGDLDLAALWQDAGYRAVTLVNAGGSVTLAALSLAILLGCRTAHLFGFDCHIGAGTYADGIIGVGAMKGEITVEVEGETFQTTTPYLSFAQQFHLLRQMALEQGQLDATWIYGPSLATAMSKENIRGD